MFTQFYGVVIVSYNVFLKLCEYNFSTADIKKPFQHFHFQTFSNMLLHDWLSDKSPVNAISKFCHCGP